MSDKNTNNLKRWWWPGQWLKICCSIWFDQSFYIQTIKPKIGDKNTGRIIFIQTYLGSIIITLFIFSILLIIEKICFNYIPEKPFLILFFLIIFISPLLLLWIIKIDYLIPGLPTLLPICINVLFIKLAFLPYIENKTILNVLFYIIFCVLLGISTGIVFGIIQTIKLDYKVIVLWAFILYSIIGRNIYSVENIFLKLIILIVTVTITYFIGSFFIIKSKGWIQKRLKRAI